MVHLVIVGRAIVVNFVLASTLWFFINPEKTMDALLCKWVIKALTWQFNFKFLLGFKLTMCKPS